jgi:hypothetical protein
MKIKEKTSSQVLTVYAIYWCDSQTYFYAFPKHSTGISSFAEDEVEIVDRSVDSSFEYLRTSERIAGIFHKHLLADGLMDRLLEHDPDAFKRFVSLIGKEP